MTRRTASFVFALTLLAGCSHRPVEVQMVDLNRVLDTFDHVMHLPTATEPLVKNEGAPAPVSAAEAQSKRAQAADEGKDEEKGAAKQDAEGAEGDPGRQDAPGEAAGTADDEERPGNEPTADTPTSDAPAGEPTAVKSTPGEPAAGAVPDPNTPDSKTPDSKTSDAENKGAGSTKDEPTKEGQTAPENAEQKEELTGERLSEPQSPEAVRIERTMDAFLAAYAAALNEAKLLDTPIGVHFLADGSIEGFLDLDANGRRNGTRERHLFKVQIDAPRNRLIASDEVRGYHRDLEFNEPADDSFGKVVLAEMHTRQDMHYELYLKDRPDFEALEMSPKGYFSQALREARRGGGTDG